MKNSEIKIVLLLGGASPERNISKKSAKSVYKTLIELGYTVTPLDPAYGKNQPEDTAMYFADEDFAAVSVTKYPEVLNPEYLKETDLVFNIIHGEWGEDGTVQSLLEMCGVKYTGSGVLSSAAAMDKALSKILFRHAGVPTADWVLLDKNEFAAEMNEKEVADKIGYPCVIKPNNGGSTIGLTICSGPEMFEKAVMLAFEYADLVLAEKFIDGRELTVGILNNKALPVLEIKPKHGIYDFECKYTDGMSVYEVPAQISTDIAEQLQLSAESAFKSCRCRDYGRVDFRLKPDGSFYCLEINTLPGMTNNSLLPKMARAAGIEFSELIEKIVRISL